MFSRSSLSLEEFMWHIKKVRKATSCCSVSHSNILNIVWSLQHNFLCFFWFMDPLFPLRVSGNPPSNVRTHTKLCGSYWKVDISSNTIRAQRNDFLAACAQTFNFSCNVKPDFHTFISQNHAGLQYDVTVGVSSCIYIIVSNSKGNLRPTQTGGGIFMPVWPI